MDALLLASLIAITQSIPVADASVRQIIMIATQAGQFWQRL